MTLKTGDNGTGVRDEKSSSEVKSGYDNTAFKEV